MGCVCGRLILHDAGHCALGIGESIYWNLESGNQEAGRPARHRDRRQRRHLRHPQGALRAHPRGQHGHGRLLRDHPRAQGRQGRHLRAPGHRQRRDLARRPTASSTARCASARPTSTCCPEYLRLLNPLRGLVAYGFFSHKFLRWMAPVLMMVLLAVERLPARRRPYLPGRLRRLRSSSTAAPASATSARARPASPASCSSPSTSCP